MEFRNGMRFLFIGNSATYVNEIPQSLKKLAEAAGFFFETEQITLGGYTLRQHADAETEHGARVFDEIKKGYDVVFLQDNGNCVADEAHEVACRDAVSHLVRAIRESGAEPCFYVRPPTSYERFGLSPLSQCESFDKLFPIWQRNTACRAYTSTAHLHTRSAIWNTIFGVRTEGTQTHTEHIS